MLSVTRLRELLHYDSESGVFTWRVRPTKRSRVRPGDVAGVVNHKGYRYIGVEGARCLAHRLAWFYSYEVWPTNEVDHVDRCPTNNSLSNLRDVTHAENQQNKQKAYVGNKSSGMLGVCLDRRNSKWKAHIQAFGVRKHIGFFDTKEAARVAYLSAKQTLHVHAGGV